MIRSAARRAGIAAETVNSANTDDWDEIHARVVAGEVDLLVVSPERLNSPAFRDQVLPRLTAEIGLLVVDEAHCISDWGHDFRPDYRRIRDVLARLGDVPVLACTATANDRVVADVADQITVPGTDPVVQRGALDRASLHLSVLELGPAERLAWLAAHLGDLPGSGIVYTLTVAATELVADWLRQAGHDVAAYAGSTEPDERERIEAALRANELKAVVATSALGMGFDKGDVGFVVHMGAPPSPIAYYQQVGRAGRAVDAAEVVLLPGREDQAIWSWFDATAFPPEALVRRVLERSTADAVVVPTLLVREARFEGMNVMWDGVRREAPIDKGGTTRFVLFMNGEDLATSLRVTVYDGTGRKIFERHAGLEPMTRYAEVLGGEIGGIVRNADAPDAQSRMPGGDDLVMNMAIRLGDATVMASDAPEGMYGRPRGFAVSVAPSSRAEFERIYDALVADAEVVTMPPRETFWAERFAMFTDRFGTPWMLNYADAKAEN